MADEASDSPHPASPKAGANVAEFTVSELSGAIKRALEEGFGYVRLRAAEYDDAQLARWVDVIRAQPWQESFVFFKHEDAGAAPGLARRMLAIASGLAPDAAPPAPKRSETAPARKPVRAPAPGQKRRRDPA